MKVFHSAEDYDLGPSVVTIGIFDGVHRGHHEILAQTVEQASERGVASVALTFDPHPSHVHRPDVDLPLISTLEDRLNMLEAAGLDGVVVQKYDLDYAETTPKAFVDEELIGKLKAVAVVVGEDVRFGKGNAGDGQFLVEYGEGRIDVTLIDDLGGPSGRRYSSTWVRELLEAGNVRKAAKILGRPHRLRGIVQHGFKRGRELGFPTANLPGSGVGEVPRDGVYAGWVVRQVKGSTATVHLPAAISIGTNPQFDGEERTVEAHVLGRADLNLYGEEIAIDFVDYVRPMMKMDSVEQLQAQMDDDLRKSAEILGVPVSHRVDPKDVTAR
ncbi:MULTISPECIES: bifunctional riboflavin kinase/FAD synthetase [Trueperella]|uniref:bifunctional riboflavin kinase/FAD synthetase n=1 Tax=Trueperella TaxID=1069494 RepID=UPI000838CAE0|nr:MULTISPECIES: bifunctional riboflavin kinase/FAD synthetase [Trueperella]MCM3907309.1 bifunctional riboflavin kinase/FAD synthetase [Trueperella bernardiae]MDV6238167.1 bifunctional riboflavin kinase/FAD synthetase [Trueperella bernardiae]OCW61120.1 riboflavin kinase [Trueperella bernardiae]OFS65775.1 bifunctional riboflavin kinase/FMN adenylyltransferase [Trueperella sp. HMSC08H06]OFS75793.1 bifunctional riboflavin kinase/FMN adenylyltransferase [Trueperella sp. HMSC08B05]